MLELMDWEVAQNIVASAIGGKVTPGSGNGNKKGDVVKPGFMVEVKQTGKTSMSVKHEWLTKLLKEAKNNEAIFAVFFELRDYYYWYQLESHSEETSWKSILLKEEELPSVLYTKGGSWHLLKRSQVQEEVALVSTNSL